MKTGGRGKAGGVKLAADPAAAELTARQILGMDIKGHTVGKVMLAQPVDIESRVLRLLRPRPRRAARFLAIASAEGGMDIEEVAATRPEAVARVPVDPAEGVTSAKAAEIAEAAGLPAADRRRPGQALWQVLDPRGRPPRRGEPPRPDRPGARSSPSTARSPSTTTPASGRPVGATEESLRTTTRWRRPPRPRASTT